MIDSVYVMCFCGRLVVLGQVEVECGVVGGEMGGFVQC